jgi:hypothetical protein
MATEWIVASSAIGATLSEHDRRLEASWMSPDVACSAVLADSAASAASATSEMLVHSSPQRPDATGPRFRRSRHHNGSCTVALSLIVPMQTGSGSLSSRSHHTEMANRIDSRMVIDSPGRWQTAAAEASVAAAGSIRQGLVRHSLSP